MLIKLGSNISEVSGTVAGNTFQKSQGGYQVRNKPAYKRQPSVSQQLIRSIHKTLLSAWSNLTPNQISLWNSFAQVTPIRGKFGDKHFLSGQAIFLKYQFIYAFNGLPLISSPYLYNQVPLGPEMIVNGSFNSSTNWTISAPWNISNGTANYNNTSANHLYQLVSIPANTNFLLKFEILNAPGLANFRLFNNSGSSLFKAPYNTLFTLPAGFYSWLVKSNIVSSRFRFYGYTSGTLFSVDNISLKLINS
jgi:hypothetical protein